MNSWKRYRKSGIAEMRSYILGESLENISITPGVMPEEGGMIARDPSNPSDQWYVAPNFFQRNYEEVK